MTKLIWLLALLGWVAGTACAAEEQGSAPSGVAAAVHAYELNLALGGSLAGKPATPEQVAEAQRHIEEGLQQARSAPAQEGSGTEAHRIIGLLLCATYRPAKLRTIAADPKTGELKDSTETVLSRGNPDSTQREQGLAELRLAVRTAPRSADIALDYGEALQIAGDADHATNQLNALWEQRSGLTPAQLTRAVRLLAKGAQASGKTQEEARWLRELLRLDPRDTGAAQRLTKLIGSGAAGIIWLGYEDGMAVARQQKKPVMIDFSTSWCGWCRKLEADVFTKPDVISLSREFVCIRVDGDARSDLTRAQRVDGYPTIVFLDAAGRSVHRIVGYEDAPRFLADMNKGLGR